MKKPDGKRIGCAFVQFANVSEASKAIKTLNGTLLRDRPIAVDWAVGKREYQRGVTGGKSDVTDDVTDDAKDDVGDDLSASKKVSQKGRKRGKSGDVADDVMDDASYGKRVTPSVKSSDVMDDDASDDDGDSDDDASDSGDASDSDSSDDDAADDVKAPKKWHNLSTGHDVSEKKTVFLRNLSFDSEEEDLFQMMQDNFGKVLFARLVIDKVSRIFQHLCYNICARAFLLSRDSFGRLCEGPYCQICFQT